jgi:hypothetical protein
VNESTLYVEGFSYDGTGEEARFYAGRAGEEGTLLSPSGEPPGVLEQLENRNLYLRYTLSAHSSCTIIAGHRHWHSGIMYLLSSYYGTGLFPASTFLFFSLRYRTEWMPDSPKFRHLKKGYALHVHTAAVSSLLIVLFLIYDIEKSFVNAGDKLVRHRHFFR